MRKIGAIVFIFVLLSKTVYSIYWQVNFHFNQNEITRMECENKNKPELKCNGKCYLAKQLKKAESQLEGKKQESTRSIQNLKWLESSVFHCLDFPEITTVQAVFSSAEKHTFFDINFYEYQDVRSCFHPPC
jgi:hypothetical protein